MHAGEKAVALPADLSPALDNWTPSVDSESSRDKRACKLVVCSMLLVLGAGAIYGNHYELKIK